MALFNHSTRELTAKIVYYGPGLCGKTTNLKVLHSRLGKAQAGKLLSLSTAQDRTIYFDLLPVELGNIKGYTVRFQLCTVPGQVFYNETRKIVLKGVDGIVFVVDSQWSMLSHNLESFQNLRDNLHDDRVALETVPLVVQYNKRDLPSALSVEALQDSLNFHSHPYVEAVASEGVGVAETFKLISKLTFVDLLRRLQKGKMPAEAAVVAAPSAPAPAPASGPAETVAVPAIRLPEPAPATFQPAAAEARGNAPTAGWKVPSADGVFADLSEESPPVAAPGVEIEAAASDTAPSRGAPKPPESPRATVLFPSSEEDGQTQEISATRLRSRAAEPPELETALAGAREEAERERRRLEENLEKAREEDRTERQRLREALEKAREEDRAERRHLEEALKEAREELVSERKRFEETLAEAREEDRTDRRRLEEALQRARQEGEEERRRQSEAMASESAHREEAERSSAQRIAALEEELNRLKAELQEARTLAESLKDAAEETSRRWATALRRTLTELVGEG